MANAFQFSQTEILVFAMILLRIGGFVVTWPVFGTKSVPAPVKILLAVGLSFILMPTIEWRGAESIIMSNSVMWMALKEATIGVMLGFMCRLYFFAVSIAGQNVSFAMGLSNAQLMNPTLGTSGSAVEQFEVALATLFFLAINGHHMFLQGMGYSFTVLPLTAMSFSFDNFIHFGTVAQEVIVIGIKLSAPVMVAILFMNIAMGIVGRAVPQINVLITSLPVNILVGFAVMLISIPLFISEMDILMDLMAERLFMFMKGL